MTVEAIAEALSAEIISLPDPDRVPETAYCGDLLSWVMGHAKPDSAWVTIMTNKNVLAVASLLDLPLVIICENAETESDFADLAKQKQINVIRCGLDCFGVCSALTDLLK